MIRACIFDMDGVIVDSAKYHFAAWQRLAHELSIEFTVQDNELLKGRSRVDSLDKILQMGGMELDNDTKLSLMNKKNEWYLDMITEMSPKEILPGVAKFIIDIKAAGLLISLGSSSKNARKILSAIDLLETFDAVVDGNDVTFSKPDPEVFLKGANKLGVRPSETVVFEDAQSGIKAAINGGFHCVGVGEEGALKEAHHIIPNFTHFSLAELQQRFDS